MPDISQKYYDTVAEELEQNRLKSGLWARAMAETGTDDATTRAIYIRLRVAELKEKDARRAPPQSSPKPAKAKPHSKARAAGGGDLQGVGGWLLFFCVSLVILAPLTLWALVGNFSSLRSQPQFYVTLYGMYIGYTIWRGSPHGRYWARQYLVVRLLFVILCMILSVITSGALSTKPPASWPDVVGYAIGEAITNIGYIAIWWAYFMRSKRVRNTYGAEDETNWTIVLIVIAIPCLLVIAALIGLALRG